MQHPTLPRQKNCAKKRTQPAATPEGRPHGLNIAFSLIVILLTTVGLYWTIAVPDLRYIPKFGAEPMTTLESKIDDAGNFVYSLRMRPTFTNFSFKPGYIDKAEFIPQSIATLPEIKVTGIDKGYIAWHQTKQVEITFLLTLPTDAAHNLNTTRELDVDQVLATFDNTGARVDHLTDGRYGRIRFNLKQGVDIRLRQIVPAP